ncbi:MAG: ATP-binding protein [Desulfobaccales bacterium]
MKICVCGKGGSGKSVVVALLAEAFQRLGKKVLILDSDESNANLFWMLGFDHPPEPLMSLVGGKKHVQQKMLARFTKGENEPAMSIWEMAGIPSHSLPAAFVTEKGGRRLVATGKIHQALEGCACPMGAVTREFLKKLELAPDEVALVDLEAGIEHFGRGLEASVDLVLCVVEPSLESITMAAKVMGLTLLAGAAFKGVILNKITSAEQGQLVRGKLKALGVPVIGTIEFCDDIQQACLEGSPLRNQIALAAMEKVATFLEQGAGAFSSS